MGRLRAITERDRLGEIVSALETGEQADLAKIAFLQVLDIAQAGRAALLDAVDLQDEANADLERILRGGQTGPLGLVAQAPDVGR